MSFDLSRFTRADSYLVVAQLSYRADVTRHVPPSLHKIIDLHGAFSENGPEAVMRWTDQRLAYAAAHKGVPDVRREFPRQVRHTEADSFLTIAELAYRGGLTTMSPPISFIERRHGPFTRHGSDVMLMWVHRRISEAATRLTTGLWHT